ncbi:MAG: ABC transporter permease, partial [Desulfurococcaceae archaeon]
GVKAAKALCTSLEGEFELYAREAGKSQLRGGAAPPSPEELKNYTLIGRIARGVRILDVPLNLSRRSLVEVVLIYADRTCYARGILPVEQIPGPEVFIAAPFISQANLFAQFFPILMLYLAYVYIAKPRSQGALEFLLARPITRLEVYLTRLVAGVLVAVAASALFYLAAAATTAALTGVVFDVHTYVLLYAGTVLSLTAFYSLCYALSTVLKGGRYLAISIFAYLFFTIILQILVSVLAIAVVGLGPGFTEQVTKLNYQAAYFSPLGIRQFFEYFTLVHYSAKYGESLAPQVGDVVNPLLVALSAATWIAVPAVLGWLAFRRANLSG